MGIEMPCGCNFGTMYVHKSGATEGENTQHIHFIGKAGSTTHKHPNTGPHVHEREDRMEREGKVGVQTGYREGG